MTHHDIIKAETYSISEAARVLGVSLRTVQRWVRDGHIPEPKVEIVRGQLVKSWGLKEMTRIRQFKAECYRGKGMDRRKGSRAKQRKP